MRVSWFVVPISAALLVAGGWWAGAEMSRDERLSALDERVERLAASAQRDREARRGRSPREWGESSEPVHAGVAGEVAARPVPLDAGTPAAARGNAEQPVPPTAQEIGKHLEEEFLSAPDQDPQWSRQARSLAEGKLRELLPASSLLRSVECRAAMCRIETSHADISSYRRFVERAVLDSNTHLWNGGAFSMIVDRGSSPSGPIATVAYLAREGQGLPWPPQQGAAPR